MGNIISAIHDDIDEYVDLCKKYGETVVQVSDNYGNWHPDAYGKHARDLKGRQLADWAKARKMNGIEA